MAKVFFSYSHKDEALRNELETHLAMLKRDGSIETWHDRRILAGAELNNEIDENLEQADIVLLLVSAHFLASDYCFQREMTRALEKHRENSATVIPVFLRPCDWKGAPFGHLMGVPTDAKPVTMYANQDEAFSIIAAELRRVAAKYPSANTQQGTATQVALPASAVVASASSGRPASHTLPRSSNLAIKRKFDDHECDEYLENTFEYMARHFQGSLQELNERNAQIKTRFKRIDANCFAAWIYDNGKLVSECTVYHGGGMGFGGSGIRYSNSADANRNSFNECLTVDNDGYTLHLKSLMNGAKSLTDHGAAELYWANLVGPLQR
jgi:hypothetical protein